MSDGKALSVMTVLGKGLLVLAVLTGSVVGGRWLQRSVPDSERPLLTNDHAEINHAPQSDDGQLISRSQILYGQHCAKCHGEQGHGDGEGLQPLTIRPRDFRSGQWRFAKNQNSIEQVIRDGIPGTPMPSAKSALSEEDISQLARLVLKLGTTDHQSQESERDNDIASSGFAPVIPGQIPKLKLLDEVGRPIDLSNLGSGPAVIHFWGTSCIHCLKELPTMNTFAKRLHAAGIRTVSICGDQGDPSEITEFGRDNPDMHFYVDPTGLAMNRFSTSLLPTLYLVDKNHTVIAVTHSALTDAQVDDIISILSD